MSALDDVVRRVRQLYALAASTSSEGEASNAMAAADRLMQAHRLAAADLEDKPPVPVEAVEPLIRLSRLPTWIGRLAVVVSRHYGCAVYNDREKGVRIIGAPDDVEMARMQFEYLKRQVERLSRIHAAPRGAKFTTGYLNGMVVTIDERLKQSRREVAGTGTAIVKVDARFASADAVMRSRPDLRLTRGSRRRVRRDGYAAGAADGRHVNFGAEVGAGSRVRGLLGGGS